MRTIWQEIWHEISCVFLGFILLVLLLFLCIFLVDFTLRYASSFISVIIYSATAPIIIGIIVAVIKKWAQAINYTDIKPGYVGIKVKEDGSQKKVEDFPLLTGRIVCETSFFSSLETVYQFPTFIQTVGYRSITLSSSEGVTINCDVSIEYMLIRDKIPSIFMELRETAEKISAIHVRSQVSNTFSRIASTMKVIDILGNKKHELLLAVQKDLNDRLGPKGFMFDMISFVGAIRVDENFRDSIFAAISTTQKAIQAENKIRQSEAEAKQIVASAEGEAQSLRKIGEAKADVNKLMAETLTPEVLTSQAVDRWDGAYRQVPEGSVIPIVQLPVMNASPSKKTAPSPAEKE